MILHFVVATRRDTQQHLLEWNEARIFRENSDTMSIVLSLSRTAIAFHWSISLDVVLQAINFLCWMVVVILQMAKNPNRPRKWNLIISQGYMVSLTVSLSIARKHGNRSIKNTDNSTVLWDGKVVFNMTWARTMFTVKNTSSQLQVFFICGKLFCSIETYSRKLLYMMN